MGSDCAQLNVKVQRQLVDVHRHRFLLQGLQSHNLATFLVLSQVDCAFTAGSKFFLDLKIVPKRDGFG